MKHILFICVGNACRSQMAEAIFNHFAPQGWEAISAGSNPGRQVHPLVVKALGEMGIDHSQAQPKGVTEELIAQAERAVGVCSEDELQPLQISRKRIEYWQIPDPYSPVDDAYLPSYRQTRDQVKQKVLELVEDLKART